MYSKEELSEYTQKQPDCDDRDDHGGDDDDYGGDDGHNDGNDDNDNYNGDG